MKMDIQNRQINEEVLKCLFRDYEITLERVNKIVIEADMRLQRMDLAPYKKSE